MTDKDIVKALECCRDCCCKQCETEPDFQDALNLINRQQETIETLRKCVEQHHIIRKDGKSPLSLLTAEIRAEAIKEFAEKVKGKAFKHYFGGFAYEIKETDIDNLVKEMVGEDK